MARYPGRTDRHAVIALADPRFYARCVALAMLLTGLLLPAVIVDRPIYDVVAVLDITGSMNVRDQHADGAVISRIAMEKRAMHRLLASLPCGSSLGLAIFVEKQPFLLFVPVATCENFSALDEEIETINWRMGWDSESHIADGVLSAIDMASRLGADLIFMTDGQEAPPLWWAGAPDLTRVRGRAKGLIVGVGGHDFSPIPRYDAQGHEVGVMRPGDVPSERDGMFLGREHLSAVDEPHLRSLATASGLTYVHLDSDATLLPALARNTPPRVHATRMDLRGVPMAAALLLLLVVQLPLAKRQSRKAFFSEEKNQKTFTNRAAGDEQRRRAI